MAPCARAPSRLRDRDTPSTGRFREVARVFGQLLVSSMALRGFACSHPELFIMPAPGRSASPREPPSEECQKLCAPLLGKKLGCEVAVEINSCEIGLDGGAAIAEERNDDGKLEPRIFVICDMQVDPMFCGAGRRPSGLLPAARRSLASPVGAHFAELARLEAASIHAFRELAAELFAHGAPPALVRAAMSAAEDEIRHARSMARLARRFGADLVAADVVHQPVRDIETIALSNAVEGCVRETFGALLAHHAAGVATLPDVRAAMAVIAGDETRHAALSWAIHAWLVRKLTPAAQRRIQAAIVSTAAAVSEEATADERPRPEIDALGLPPADVAAGLLRGLGEPLWNVSLPA
jgi:hypothetical protein